MKFFLSPLPLTRIDATLPVSARQTLKRIVDHNKARFLKGADSPQLRNRKDEMKNRLINRGKATFEQVTDEVGRERVLLSLYLEYGVRTDAKWLPVFDHSISRSVLGENGSYWHAGRRRQATHLFFVHYNYLPPAGLAHLCTLLVQAYAGIDPNGQELAVKWCSHRATLFSSTGHVDIIRESRSDESLPTFTQRVGVPEEGRFVECLRQEFLLNELKRCPLGGEIPALEMIESLRTKRADASLCMGAAALRIMVQRVAKEGKRKWTGIWPRWITRFGCDPRHGRSSAEGAKWWGWATDDELRLAQQGITGLTLKFFIEFLDGTVSASQWKGRSDFLTALFEAGKIDSARLALNYSTYQRLDREFRDPWTVSHLSQTADNTSMICLRCVDDIHIIEGTHNFALRVFHRKFPIPKFWDEPSETYQDRELRISPGKCPVFLAHTPNGNWTRQFFVELRNKFHVEWSDVFTAPESRRFAPTPSYQSAPSRQPFFTEPQVVHRPAADPPKSEEAKSSASLESVSSVVDRYVEELRRFLINAAMSDSIASRRTLLKNMEETGRIKEAKLVRTSEDRHFLLLRCTDRMILVDAAHYTDIRGACNAPALWNQLVSGSEEECARLLREHQFELRVEHHPSAGYAGRFLDALAFNCGVAWDNVMF